jgi:hypothetical protein
VPTVTPLAGPKTGRPVVGSRVTLKNQSLFDGVVPLRATAKPMVAVSTWIAGTGVKTGWPVESTRARVAPTLNVLGAGQTVPVGGLLIATRRDPRKAARELKMFTPMMRKNPLWPSFGKSGFCAPKPSV